MPFHFVVLYIIRTSLHIFHLAWKLALSGTREPIGNMRNVIKSFVILLTFTFARADPDTLYKEGLSTRQDLRVEDLDLHTVYELRSESSMQQGKAECHLAASTGGHFHVCTRGWFPGDISG